MVQGSWQAGPTPGVLAVPCGVDLDDFFLCAASVVTLLNILRQVLVILDGLGPLCEGDKCELGVTEIAVLGHIVNAGGIDMGADRKTAVDAVLSRVRVRSCAVSLA